MANEEPVGVRSVTIKLSASDFVVIGFNEGQTYLSAEFITR